MGGKKGQEGQTTDLQENKLPILYQHDAFKDAEKTLRDSDVGEPWLFTLQQQGYDVWLGNNRGTKYSDVNFNDPQTDRERWNFTMADMAIYDLTAEIDTIRNVTGAEKVNYIGYSEGALQMFYALVKLEDEYFADKLNQFVALAPCVFIETEFKSRD